jgi:hypothetical protein
VKIKTEEIEDTPMGIGGIGGRADADGSGSSAYKAAPAIKPKTEPTAAAGAGSASTAVPAKAGAGRAAFDGGFLPSAEPEPPAIAAGARKSWDSVAGQVTACRNVDIVPLIPFLNEIARGATAQDKGAIEGAIRGAGNLDPEISLPGIHDPGDASVRGHCVDEIFNKQEVGETLVRQGTRDDQFARAVDGVFALSAALKRIGGLKEAPEDLAALSAAIVKAYAVNAIENADHLLIVDEMEHGATLAKEARSIIYRAAEWVTGPRVADGRSSSPSEQFHRLAELVSSLIKGAGSDEETLDRNLVAAVVIVCTKAMGNVYIERLQGMLEGMVKPPNEEIAEWPARIEKWFAPIIEWIGRTIELEERADEQARRQRIVVVRAPE